MDSCRFLRPGKPVLVNAVIDPTAGTESGHIQSLNPRSAVAQKT
jgi:oxalyl-CoA decarboxylase